MTLIILSVFRSWNQLSQSLSSERRSSTWMQAFLSKFLKAFKIILLSGKTNLKQISLWVSWTYHRTSSPVESVRMKCCLCLLWSPFQTLFLVYIQWDLVTWCLMCSVSSLSSVDKWYPLGSTASKAFRPLAGQMSSYQLTSGLSHRQTDRQTNRKAGGHILQNKTLPS